MDCTAHFRFTAACLFGKCAGALKMVQGSTAQELEHEFWWFQLGQRKAFPEWTPEPTAYCYSLMGYARFPLTFLVQLFPTLGGGAHPVFKPQSQRLSEDSFHCHMASMTRECHFTFPPRWYLFNYSHLHAFELLGWQGAGTKQWELTPSRGFDLATAGLLTLQHRLLQFSPQNHQKYFLNGSVLLYCRTVGRMIMCYQGWKSAVQVQVALYAGPHSSGKIYEPQIRPCFSASSQPIPDTAWVIK